MGNDWVGHEIMREAAGELVRRVVTQRRDAERAAAWEQRVGKTGANGKTGVWEAREDAPSPFNLTQLRCSSKDAKAGMTPAAAGAKDQKKRAHKEVSITFALPSLYSFKDLTFHLNSFLLLG